MHMHVDHMYIYTHMHMSVHACRAAIMLTGHVYSAR